MLAEKSLDHVLVIEPVWDRRREFLSMNPAGDVPVLIEPEGTSLTHSQVIAEYLEETYPDEDRTLLGKTPLDRAEVRRLVAWFDEKFNREVTDLLVGERVIKRLTKQGQPNSAALRAGLSNIKYHLEYIAFLTDRRRWLAGESFSLADIAAAAHLSCIDYLGDVPWTDYAAAQDWYRRVKCRPSVRPLLSDLVPGVSPPSHYKDLDF